MANKSEEFKIVQGKYIHFSYVERFVPGLNRWKVIQHKEKFPGIIQTITENGKTYPDMIDILLARQVVGYEPNHDYESDKPFEKRFLKETKKESSTKLRNPFPSKTLEKIRLNTDYKKKILDKYPQYADEISKALQSGEIRYSRLDEIGDEISEKTSDCGIGEKAISEISDLLFKYGVTLDD